MVHCSNDLEISLTDVIRLQKYSNANVEWFHDILGSGEFWGHEDRIKKSSVDFGAQAAPLRLLLKDHKPYDIKSGDPVPSRPVVNGKSGYNCHLSEVLSMVLGPVAKEATGSEINSTMDLLSRVDSMNSVIADTNLLKVCGSPLEPTYCDHCRKCNNPEPSEADEKFARDFIEKVSKF